MKRALVGYRNYLGLLNVVTLLEWTPVIELSFYMAKLVVKNAHQTDTYYDEIELCV